MISEQQRRLSGFDFKLIVDGRALRRPVYLTDNPNGYTTIKIERQTHRVYGRNLTFSGYIVVQEGRQLHPDELRGVMIRIKNVGIGYYDPSMLDYRINEGPRSRWLTGEIFVEEGLEDALNIDRDSFNRFHPEFKVLQGTVHEVLQKQVFSEVYRNIEKRSKARQAKKTSERRKALREAVQTSNQRTLRLVEQPGADVSSSAREEGTRIEVVVPKADDLKTSKRARELAQAMLAIFEVALLERGKEAQRKKFSELLLQLLKSW